MAAVANIGVSVTARVTKFMKGMKRVRRALNRFGKRVSAVGAGLKRITLAAGAFTVAAGAAFGKVLMAGERFNRKMNQSQAIMSGLTQTLRKDMKEAAFEAARSTVFSSEQAAESFFFLASAGLDAQQSIKALPLVAKFAQAGMFDMATATDLLTDAQSALGLTSKDPIENMENMSRVSDVLVKANTLANASVQQFSESLTTKAGAALKILNKDITEGVAVLAAFADQGVKGADAGTALNIVLRDLSTKGLRNADAFRKAGIAVFDAAGNMRNIGQIVGDIENKLDGMSDAQKKATLLQLGFTDKSVIFIQTLLGMSEKIGMYEHSLRRAGGTTEMVASKQMTQLQMATAKLEAAWSKFGDAVQPIMTALADGLTVAIEAINERFLKNFSQERAVKIFTAFLRAAEGFWLQFKIIANDAIAAVIATVGKLAGVPVFGKLLGDKGELFKKRDEFRKAASESRTNLDRLLGDETTDAQGREFLSAAVQRMHDERLAQQEFQARREKLEQGIESVDAKLAKKLKVEDVSTVKAINTLVDVVKLGVFGVPTVQ